MPRGPQLTAEERAAFIDDEILAARQRIAKIETQIEALKAKKIALATMAETRAQIKKLDEENKAKKAALRASLKQVQ